jgi:hypothetical protein
MASTAIHERRRTLRYRNLLVRQTVQMKIKTRQTLHSGKSEGDSNGWFSSRGVL